MKISGSNYSPTAWKSIIAQVFCNYNLYSHIKGFQTHGDGFVLFYLQVIGFGKIALIVMIVMGTNPFSASGMETPRIVNWAFSNKLSCCMMLFLISNAVESKESFWDFIKHCFFIIIIFNNYFQKNFGFPYYIEFTKTFVNFRFSYVNWCV